MSGLEQLGIAGGDHLREALTNCSDPLAAIEEFQRENGIILPSLQPALPFLDLFGVSRLEFHDSVFEEMREKLLQRIASLARSDDPKKNEKLGVLLDKCFPVIKHEMMRPIVMCILKHLPRLKEGVLSKILKDPELYKDAAMEVKRQIWQDNQAVFGDEVSPLLTQYIHDKENRLFNHTQPNALSFFHPSPKSRRQDEVVTRLIAIIGTNVKLYDMVLQFLRTLFLRTRNAHYCTLRAEILMALHDGDVHEICNIDPCHKFTWCIDACVRERRVDVKRARELQGFLDGIKKGQEQVLGDLTMILCDPFALHTMALSLMKALQDCFTTDKLPRDNRDLMLLLRMLSLGLGAWNMIDSQTFREPRLEPALVTKFLTVIADMLVDDQLHMTSTKERQPPDIYAYYIRNSGLASLVSMYYVLQLTAHKARMLTVVMLPTLLFCDDDKAYEDTFLHLLVANLIAMVEDFTYSEFCSSVFGEFLLPNVSRDNVHCHTLHLLYHVYHTMPATDLSDVLESVTPGKDHSETVHAAYKELKDKMATKPSAPPVREKHTAPMISTLSLV